MPDSPKNQSGDIKLAAASALMAGKKGLITGVANDRSIAWGIANILSQHGAEMAFTYQGEAFGKRVRPLAESVGSTIVLPCDVEDESSMDAVFDALKKDWGGLDFVVHAIAFSDKEGSTMVEPTLSASAAPTRPWRSSEKKAEQCRVPQARSWPARRA